MIITKLIGGLGNQMFQYAAGLALAEQNHTVLKVDISQFNKVSDGSFTLRDFELNNFELEILIANESEIKPFLSITTSKLQRVLQRSFPNYFKTLYLAESGNSYYKKFNKCPENTYLDGFWQSELYFKKFKSNIKKDFTFKQSIIDRNKDIVSEMVACNSISLHIRRGDYVNNNATNQFHGLCSLDYYNNAVSFFENKFQTIELFVFSDDINWCKENLQFDLPLHFIETNDAHSDLYLMTQCKHNIIANSSFSWWGAWLNNNQKKIVIAPKQWFADNSVITKDIIPVTWIKI